MIALGFTRKWDLSLLDGYKFNTWYDMIWMEKMIEKHKPNQEDVKYGKWKTGE